MFTIDDSSEEYKISYSRLRYLPYINIVSRPKDENGTCLEHIFVKQPTREEELQTYLLKNNKLYNYIIFLK